MNLNLVNDCRAFGQTLSKNVQQNCPHCQEPTPHLINEEKMLEEEEKNRSDLTEL